MRPTPDELTIAWRTYQTCLTTSAKLLAAEAVLRGARADLYPLLDRELPQALESMDPERLGRLASLVHGYPSPPALTEALLAEVQTLRASASDTWRRRRLAALFSLIWELNLSTHLRVEDVLWLAENPDVRCVFLLLTSWCTAQPRVPAAVAAAVRQLREDDIDSPVLDRLAAWVHPSATGMLDLAAWENGYRAVFDAAWCAATARWQAGALDPVADTEVLRETIESSHHTATIEQAVARHGEQALAALRAAHAEAPPVLRVILAAWIEKFCPA